MTEANTRTGVVAFVNATADYTLVGGRPSPAGITGWDTSAGMDLVMTAIPEPSTFALAGLGVAILWTLRPRN